MNRENCRVGMPVVFGSTNGAKTRGIIRKLNSVCAKIELAEPRGRWSIGSMWNMPYSGISEANSGSHLMDAWRLQNDY